MPVAAIYEIRNIENDHRYIGSAANLEGRFAVHRHYLLHGKHHSRYLQRAFNKHGAARFVFRPLLICAKRDLLFYEQRAIDELNPEYNHCRIAGNALGVRWTAEARARHSVLQNARPTFKGRKHTAETLEKMSLSKLGNTHTKGQKRDPAAVAKTAAAHRGMKRSAETRARIAAKAKGRVWTAAAKAKLSATTKGRKVPESRRLKMLGNKNALGKKRFLQGNEVAL
jgi:group I intron endonuclease